MRRENSFVDRLPVLLYRATADSNWSAHFLSSGVEELTGHPPATFATPGVDGGLNFFDLVHPEDKSLARRTLDEALAAKKDYVNEFRIIRADGSMRHVQDRGRGAFDADGNLTHVEGVVIDVSDARLLEVQLRENAESLKRLTLALDVSERRVRRHVASILHDDLQQLLVACALKAQLLSQNKTNTAETVSAVVELVNKALHTSRSLVSYLNHSSLASGKLEPSIAFLKNWCCENYGLEVNAEVLCRETLPVDTAALAFECVRELLFNVYKHAGASRASVNIGEHARMLHVVVIDNGRGFDSETLKRDNAFGLVTLKARVREAGGRFALTTAPGSGVQVEIRLPFTGG